MPRGDVQWEWGGRLYQLQRRSVRVGCSHERVDVQRSVWRGSLRVCEWADVVVVCRELQRGVRMCCGVCQLHGVDLSGGSVLAVRVGRMRKLQRGSLREYTRSGLQWLQWGLYSGVLLCARVGVSDGGSVWCRDVQCVRVGVMQ